MEKRQLFQIRVHPIVGRSRYAPVIVTHRTSNSVVIMSLEDYEALEETAYLLRSPKNTRRLIESIAQLRYHY